MIRFEIEPSVTLGRSQHSDYGMLSTYPPDAPDIRRYQRALDKSIKRAAIALSNASQDVKLTRILKTL